MDLPKNLKTFNFDATGDTTGQEYKGQFTVKCTLTILEKRLLETEKSQMRADFANPTPNLIAYATILSNLRIRITDGPEWWKQSSGGDDLLDENVLTELFEKVMDQEFVWRDELKGKKDASEGNLKEEK